MAPRVGKIHRKATFRALARPDGRATSGPVSVAFSRSAPEALGGPLAGYAIGKRHGGAVVRNRLRRRLRAAIGHAAPDLAPGAYLVRARPGASDLPFAELEAAVRAAASAAGDPPAAHRACR